MPGMNEGHPCVNLKEVTKENGKGQCEHLKEVQYDFFFCI